MVQESLTHMYEVWQISRALWFLLHVSSLTGKSVLCHMITELQKSFFESSRPRLRIYNFCHILLIKQVIRQAQIQMMEKWTHTYQYELQRIYSICNIQLKKKTLFTIFIKSSEGQSWGNINFKPDSSKKYLLYV